MSGKPKFDPSKPFRTVDGGVVDGAVEGQASGLGFDPSRPFKASQVPLDAGPSEASSTPTEADAFFRGATQGVSFGFGDELWGALRAAGDSMPVALGGSGMNESMADAYRRNRDAQRIANARAEAAHGGYYLGGSLAGGLATAPLMPGAGTGRTLWQLAKTGAKVGAASGAAYGVGSSDADLTSARLSDVGQVARDGAVGAGAGLVLGGTAPVIARGTANIVRTVSPYVRGGYIKPTAEAQRLINEGADLTLGHMDPKSPLGRYEDIGANNALGGSLSAARDRSANSIRDVVLSKAAAPGAKPPTRGAPSFDQIEQIAQGFSDGYERVLDNVRIQPDKYLGSGRWRGFFTDETLRGSAKTKGAFEMAVDVPDAPGSVKTRALAWLKDAANRNSLVPRKSGADAGSVDARAVQQFRGDLRKKIAAYEGKTGDEAPHFSDIYKNAERFTTELLEGQLPPEHAEALRAMDKSYRNKLAVEAASSGSAAFKRGPMGGDFNPAEFLESVRKVGATPELESIARDAYSIHEAKFPLTGVQHVAAEVAPIAKFLGPAWAQAANLSPGLRRHALRPAAAPGMSSRAISAVGRLGERLGVSPVTQSAGTRTLYELLTEPRFESFAEWDRENQPVAVIR